MPNPNLAAPATTVPPELDDTQQTPGLKQATVDSNPSGMTPGVGYQNQPPLNAAPPSAYYPQSQVYGSLPPSIPQVQVYGAPPSTHYPPSQFYGAPPPPLQVYGQLPPPYVSPLHGQQQLSLAQPQRQQMPAPTYMTSTDQRQVHGSTYPASPQHHDSHSDALVYGGAAVATVAVVGAMAATGALKPADQGVGYQYGLGPWSGGQNVDVAGGNLAHHQQQNFNLGGYGESHTQTSSIGAGGLTQSEAHQVHCCCFDCGTQSSGGWCANGSCLECGDGCNCCGNQVGCDMQLCKDGKPCGFDCNCDLAACGKCCCGIVDCLKACAKPIGDLLCCVVDLICKKD